MRGSPPKSNIREITDLEGPEGFGVSGGSRRCLTESNSTHRFVLSVCHFRAFSSSISSFVFGSAWPPGFAFDGADLNQKLSLV